MRKESSCASAAPERDPCSVTAEPFADLEQVQRVAICKTDPWAALQSLAELKQDETMEDVPLDEIVGADGAADAPNETAVRLKQRLRRGLQQIKGHQFAKSAFDCAWWDAFSKYKKQPLWKLIGGVNQTVSVGADFPVQSTSAELLSKVDRAVADGFRRIKIKFNPQSNVASIAEIRSKYPDMLIHVDCNSGFSLDDIELFKQLDELGLAMIEQPLAYDDLIFHAELQSKINTPICLDESISSVDRARKAIDIDACRYINIKTSRVGGLSNAIEIHNLCQDRGIPVWVGGMLESAVGQSFSLALATMPNVGYPNDIFPSRRFYQVDMSMPEIVLSSPGMIEAPRSLGAGFAPNLNKLVTKSVKSASISA